MVADQRRIETKLIHAGEPEPRIHGSVSMPIFQTANFLYEGETNYHDIKYIRFSNTPNHEALCKKIASLENAESALVTGSGMAALSASLLSILSNGDHLLVQDCVYGGTHDLITKDFPGFGIAYDLVDACDPSSWQDRLRGTTRAILVESISNPLMQVADLKAVVKFANANGLVSIIDNTFTTPVNFRPIEWGFHLSLHSATKYLNGHSDIVAGVVVGQDTLISEITDKLIHLGGALDPHACFLLHRGLKTLAVRVNYQNKSAEVIAQFLAEHPAVSTVNYPGLETHPQHQRAVELFDGFGGMISFEIVPADVQAAERFMRRAQLPLKAGSLGGVESLLTRPATTSHSGMSPEDRLNAKITDSLIRISVGLEATDELIADLEAALA